jgi:hypothetical protein
MHGLAVALQPIDHALVGLEEYSPVKNAGQCIVLSHFGRLA